MEILLWIFGGGLEGRDFFGLVRVPVRVIGVRGGGGGGESSLASALLVGTVIWRWSVEGRWREEVDQEAVEGAEAAPVLKVLTLAMTDGCLDS